MISNGKTIPPRGARKQKVDDPETHWPGAWKYGLTFDMPDGTVETVWVGSCGSVHASVWMAGACAAIAGRKKLHNPYLGDVRGSNGRVALGRRGFRNAWEDGWEAAVREGAGKEASRG